MRETDSSSVHLYLKPRVTPSAIVFVKNRHANQFGETRRDEWSKQGDGLGVDGAIDAAGVSATLKSAIHVVRPNGWISKVGWGPQPLNFSLDPLVQKNIQLRGSFSHNWPIWERVIRLLSTGMLNVNTPSSVASGRSRIGMKRLKRCTAGAS